MTAVRIGVSACLLGQKVRYDGGHKKDDFITGALRPFVRFVSVCPELELGLGVPREPIRLEGGARGTRLMAVKSGRDLTDAMTDFSRDRAAGLADEDLCGFIFKRDSPSCGMERVKVHRPRGGYEKSGRGLFAGALMARFPDLPVEEEGRLRDARLRENFLERVFAYRRLKTFFSTRWSLGGLVALHAREKYLLMAHDDRACRALGRLVAAAKPRWRAAGEEYRVLFMEAMKKAPGPGRHADVLQHMAGHLKSLLDAEDNRELAGAIEDYRRGLTPLITPVTLLRHHVRRRRVAYLRDQTYLMPRPKELMLRSHV
ncbi:MAG: YbgA family protein [Elusimicrobiota bacterium]